MMKKHLLAATLLAVLVGCAHGSPPSGFERTIYDVKTQVVAVVTLQTNFVLAPGTTNLVPISVSPVTNLAETYEFQTKPVVTSALSTAGGLAGTFGFPWVSPILALVASGLAAWAQYRSVRRGKLNRSLGQSLETSREIMKLQPNGAVTEARFMDSVKSEQVRAGVKSDAAELANNQVDTMEAKQSAASISKTV